MWEYLEVNVTETAQNDVFAIQKEKFSRWIQLKQITTHSPETLLACIDEMSEYALRKRILSKSLWACKQYDDFF